MQVATMQILHIAILENSESVNECFVADWISKAKVFLDVEKNVAVVFLHLSQVITHICALTHRNHMRSSMSHYFSTVLSSCEMIALCPEIDVAGALPQLLIDAFEFRVWP